MIPQTMTDLVMKFENVPILGINIFQELRCYALKNSSEWKDKEYPPTVNVLKIVPCSQKESKKRKKKHSLNHTFIK